MSNTSSLHKQQPYTKPQKSKAPKKPPPVWSPGFPGVPPGPPPHAFRQVRDLWFIFATLGPIHKKQRCPVSLLGVFETLVSSHTCFILFSPRERASSLVVMDLCPLPGLP